MHLTHCRTTARAFVLPNNGQYCRLTYDRYDWGPMWRNSRWYDSKMIIVILCHEDKTMGCLRFSFMFEFYNLRQRVSIHFVWMDLDPSTNFFWGASCPFSSAMNSLRKHSCWTIFNTVVLVNLSSDIWSCRGSLEPLSPLVSLIPS